MKFVCSNSHVFSHTCRQSSLVDLFCCATRMIFVRVVHNSKILIGCFPIPTRSLFIRRRRRLWYKSWMRSFSKSSSLFFRLHTFASFQFPNQRAKLKHCVVLHFKFFCTRSLTSNVVVRTALSFAHTLTDLNITAVKSMTVSSSVTLAVNLFVVRKRKRARKRREAFLPISFIVIVIVIYYFFQLRRLHLQQLRWGNAELSWGVARCGCLSLLKLVAVQDANDIAVAHVLETFPTKSLVLREMDNNLSHGVLACISKETSALSFDKQSGIVYPLSVKKKKAECF